MAELEALILGHLFFGSSVNHVALLLGHRQVSEVVSLLYTSWRLTVAESTVRALLRSRFDCAVLLHSAARNAFRKALVEGGGAGVGDAADAIFACYDDRKLRSASEALKCCCIAAPSSTVFVAAVRAAAFAARDQRLAAAWEDLRCPVPCAMAWSQLSDLAQASASSGAEPVDSFLERHLWPPLAAAGWTVEPLPPGGRHFVAPAGSALHGCERLLALSLIVGACHLAGPKAGPVPRETVDSIRAEQAPALIARWATLQPAAAADAAIERLGRDGAALGIAAVIARNGSAPIRTKNGKGSGSESQTARDQSAGGSAAATGPPLAGSLWGRARPPRDDGPSYRHNQVYMTQRAGAHGRRPSGSGSASSAAWEDSDPLTSSSDEQVTPCNEPASGSEERDGASSEGGGSESSDSGQAGTASDTAGGASAEAPSSEGAPRRSSSSSVEQGWSTGARAGDSSASGAASASGSDDSYSGGVPVSDSAGDSDSDDERLPLPPRGGRGAARTATQLAGPGTPPCSDSPSKGAVPIGRTGVVRPVAPFAIASAALGAFSGGAQKRSPARAPVAERVAKKAAAAPEGPSTLGGVSPFGLDQGEEAKPVAGKARGRKYVRRK